MDVDRVIYEIGYLSRETTDDHASRAVLSFFRNEPEHSIAPSKRAWSLSSLPEGAPSAWDNVNIYDVKGRLLFHDKLRDLNGGAQLCVRTAASELLGAPVWSLAAGPKFDLRMRVQRALAEAVKNELEVSLSPESLVCYCYPRLGLLCTKPITGAHFVVDLGDYSIVPVDVAATVRTAAQLTCWSPYDLVGPATIGLFRDGWRRGIDGLPPAVAEGAALSDAVADAREGSNEQSVELQLECQKDSVYCAVATAQMIFAYYGINKTQDEIALAMGTDPTWGTPIAGEAAGYDTLSGGALVATLDDQPAFSNAQQEIEQGRPLKVGTPGHARAIAGYDIDASGVQWIWVYDPLPPCPGGGSMYWENWATVYYTNFIYVRRVTHS